MVDNTARCFSTVCLRTAGRSIMCLRRISFEDHGTEPWVLDAVFAFFTCCALFASKPWVTACMTPIIFCVAWDRGSVARCFLVFPFNISAFSRMHRANLSSCPRIISGSSKRGGVRLLVPCGGVPPRAALRQMLTAQK